MELGCSSSVIPYAITTAPCSNITTLPKLDETTSLLCKLMCVCYIFLYFMYFYACICSVLFKKKLVKQCFTQA